MADSQDSILDSVLHGNLTSVPEPPSRAVKIMVVSSKTDFELERKHLHENVFPELQRFCASSGVDLEVLDSQLGTDLDSSLDPHAFQLQLTEIEAACRDSLGCFMLCLIGNKYRPCPLPLRIDASEFDPIHEKAQEAGFDVSLLAQWYALDANTIPSTYVCRPMHSKSTSLALRRSSAVSRFEWESCARSWQEEQETVLKMLQYGARVAHQEGIINQNNQGRRQRKYFMSGVYNQLDYALGLSTTAPQRIVCVIRQIEGLAYNDPAVPLYADVSSQENNFNVDEEASASLQSMVDDVIFSVNRKNLHFFNVSWREGGLDSTSHSERRFYLEKFGNSVFSNIKQLMEEDIAATTPDWQNLPPKIRKPIQEVVRESQSHLSNSRQHLRVLGVSQSLDSDCGALLQIQNLMLGQEDCSMRHSPVIVCGQEGSGKSTLLSQVFMYCPEWLGSDVVRVVRHVGRSPCTSFTPELLRNLCLHISLLFGFEISPSHYSFELGKLSIWFQDLLKLVEAKDNDLVIVLDDLHALRCAPNNQASILGWLPWNLPPNVHIVCSVAEDEGKILGLLRTRIGDNFVFVPPLNASSALSMMQSTLRDDQRALTTDQWAQVRTRLSGGQSVCPLYVKLLAGLAKRWPSHKTLTDSDIPLDIQGVVSILLSDLESRYGETTLRKVCVYLTCTAYGLREAEVVELLASSEYEAPPPSSFLMPVDEDTPQQHERKVEFSAVNWLHIKKEMGILLKTYYVDKRPYLYWSHSSIADAVRARYLPGEADSQQCHADLANAFHLGFLMEKEQKGSPSDESKSKRKEDWSDMLREIDELWYHLMLSGDHKKLKQDAVCNFDFLYAATRGASVSYTRSILEIVRCQMLDWEVELLYSMTKQSVDVLSQDPQQLATEIINWLKPLLNGTTKTMDALVTNAREWCSNASTVPLLVPQNNWLSLSLPPQVTVMTCPRPLSHVVVAPDSQHIMGVTGETSIEMFHLPSRNLVKVFTGHKARITCLHVTLSGKWLISGSKDSEIIIWDMDNGTVDHKFSHHTSGVQCLTTVHSELLIVSGSDSGVVVVSRLDTGLPVHRLENHRGVVSSVAVNAGDDVLASASTDRCVCIWSLDDFSLLNTLHLSSPITHMTISADSTFLLLACTDHSVHVRSLATGSDVHCLYGHGGTAVTALAFARDGCRCAVGCKDGKVHLFDVHSAKVLQTLSGHSDPVTSVQVQDNDRFLVSVGGSKVVVWNFFGGAPRKSCRRSITSRKEDKHLEPVTCVAVSRDGALAVSGSRDKLVKVWQLHSGELHATLQGHTGPVTCVAFSPNGLFAVSGSEDHTLRVWGLTLGLVVSTFQEHQSKVTAVAVTSDSRRVLSVDSQSQHRLWQADTGQQLVVCAKPSHNVAVHANMVFAIGGKNDCSLKFWPVTDMESEKSVSHSDAITCFTVTYDCQTIVTGSNDMSLKVWEVGSGKLTQVLVGHESPVTCAAVAPLSPSLAVSGSADCNLIVWDLTTGCDTFTLRGHTEAVTSVRLTLDGSIAVSASDDNTLGMWNTSQGLRMGLLGVHQSIVSIAGALSLSQVVLQLANQSVVPLLRLHNNPTKEMVLDLPPGTPVTEEAKTPGHSWRGVVPQRVLLRGNLKREQSFDSFYWDLRSSPKHSDLGLSLEDFRRAVPSPFGSREHLHLAGTVWGGRGPADQATKAKLPKHKMLKKQQSMFACFPEFMTSTQAGSPQGTLISPQQGLLKEKEFGVGRMAPKLAKQKSLSRAASLEETGANGHNGHQEGEKAAVVRDSSVCVVS